MSYRFIIKISTFLLILFFISSTIPAKIDESCFKNSTIINEEETIKIAVAGDIYPTKNAQLTAARLMNMSIEDPYKRVASGFENLFSKELIENISSADISFCNVDYPIAEDLTEEWYWENGRPICKKIDVDPGILYDGVAYRAEHPAIVNAHPGLALALKNVGFDIVSTAVNHYANRASNGIDATIDSLRRANLSFVGTIRNNEIIDEDSDGYPENNAYVIKNVKNIKIAFLAFVAQVNRVAAGYEILPVFLGRLAPADKVCSKQVYFILSNNAKIKFNVQKFCEQIEKAKSEADIVCVSAHWGVWNFHNPYVTQKMLEKRFLDSGADIIIGHGPHILQPIKVQDGGDHGKKVTIYSLGNFLVDGGKEGEGKSNNLASILGFINIKKTSTGDIIIDNINYIPTFSYNNSNNTQVIIPDLTSFTESKEIIDTVMNGNTLDRMRLTQKSLTPLKRILLRDDLLLKNWILLRWLLNK